MFAERIAKLWKIFVSISIFLLLVSGCTVANVSTPTIIVPDQVQVDTSAATPLPGNSPVPTNTQVTPNTPMPTFSSSATVELTGEPTEGKKTYPQVTAAELYGNPDDYNGKSFMIDGVVIGYGMRKYEGKDVYVIQVGVIDYPDPIIVLNFHANPKLGIHDGIIVGGTGGGAYFGVDPADPTRYTPVILGEWYECNLPWDQWKYPYEFWTPIQFE